MARKKKEDAQKTRQLLIEAAIGEFATRGVANTTLTDIADAAKVTRGAVYWHFSSKAEICSVSNLSQRCNISRVNHGSVRFYKSCIINVNLKMI